MCEPKETKILSYCKIFIYLNYLYQLLIFLFSIFYNSFAWQYPKKSFKRTKKEKTVHLRSERPMIWKIFPASIRSIGKRDLCGIHPIFSLQILNAFFYHRFSRASFRYSKRGTFVIYPDIPVINTIKFGHLCNFSHPFSFLVSALFPSLLALRRNPSLSLWGSEYRTFLEI